MGKDASKKSKRSKKSSSSLPKINGAEEQVAFMGEEDAVSLMASDKGSAADDKGSKGSKASVQLPGESADGRMGADISLLIEDITDYRDLLNRHTSEDKANLAAIEKEIDVLEYRIQKIESRMQKRNTAKAEYTKTLVDTEKAFNAIVNTANSVANILKPPTEQELEALDVPETATDVPEWGKRGMGTN